MTFYLQLWLLYLCVVGNHPRNLKNIYFQNIFHALWSRVFLWWCWNLNFIQSTLSDTEVECPWTILWETLIIRFIFVTIIGKNYTISGLMCVYSNDFTIYTGLQTFIFPVIYFLAIQSCHIFLSIYFYLLKTLTIKLNSFSCILRVLMGVRFFFFFHLWLSPQK